jgi:hypothetical protein
MIRTVFLVLVGLFSFCSFGQTIPIRVVAYNLLNFPDGRNDCGTTNQNIPFRTDSLRKTLQYLQPDIFVACEIQYEAACDSILSRSLNVYGNTQYQRATYYSNTSGANNLQNMLFYNSAKLVLKEQRIIPTGVRDINHYILYVQDITLPQHHDTCFIEVFMCHLKAGSALADQLERAQQTQLLREILDHRPADRHLFVCGDLNTYRSSETGYQNLVSGGTTFLKDPLNLPGNWTSNSAFASIHTQSPRSSGSMDCGSTGGMDDRFDHILVSQNVLSGSPMLNYVNASYKAIGNDGNHYNQSILSGSNSQYPDSVVRALYYTSDHLPVKLDALASIPLTNGLNLTYSISGGNCSTAGASVTVTPNLGQAPYTYLWDSNAQNQTTPTVTGLVAGSYCVQVTDQTGLVDQVCFEVTAFPSLEVSSFVNSVQAGCDGSAFVVVTGGTAPYTCEWNDPLQTVGTAVSNLCPGTYICTITDANGCSMQETIVVQGEMALTETLAGGISLHPNPVSNLLTIESTWKQDFETIAQIISVLGQQEQPVLLSFSQGEAQLNVSNLPAGVYFIQIGGKTNRIIKR